MNRFEAFRRLNAFAKGRPLARGASFHVPLVDDRDLLIVAFVKMGGESSPWGIAYGGPGEAPQILTVPEPRDRTRVADMVEMFAPTLLEHLHHPAFGPGGWGPKQLAPLRQVWFPNTTHLEMFHFLDFAYTRSKWRGSGKGQTLNALGRAAGWVFRESRRPGQCVAMVATEVLRQLYSFPAEDARQAHLGYLLAWIESKGGFRERLARASEAELLSAATALDPKDERERLEPLVDAYNRAEKEGVVQRQQRAEKGIDQILDSELRRRFEWTDAAIGHLRKDRRKKNPGLEKLVSASREEHWYQYLRTEERLSDDLDGPAFVPSPETDHHGAAAGSRFFVFEASQAVLESVLVHYDRELQAEALAEGYGFQGTIREVVDEGEGKKTVPIWTVRAAGVRPTRLREGDKLCVAGLPQRAMVVRTLHEPKPGVWEIEAEVTEGKTIPTSAPPGTPHGSDPELVGTEVTLLPVKVDSISRRKSQKVWRRDKPGSWLTRGLPRSSGTAAAAEVVEDVEKVESSWRASH